MAMTAGDGSPYCPECKGFHFGPMCPEQPFPYDPRLDPRLLQEQAAKDAAQAREEYAKHVSGLIGQQDEIELRKLALELAAANAGEGSQSKGVVNRAENYLAFLKGEKPAEGGE